LRLSSYTARGKSSLIRQIQKSEFKQVVKVGQEFYRDYELPGSMELNSFQETWNKLYDSKAGIIIGWFSGDHQLLGAIAGIIYQDPNDGVLTATEMFWFVAKVSRGSINSVKLFKRLEKWAQEQKAKRLIMVNILSKTSHKVDKFYRQAKYRPLEIHYIKEW